VTKPTSAPSATTGSPLKPFCSKICSTSASVVSGPTVVGFAITSLTR